MSHKLPDHEPYELKGEELKRAIVNFATNPIYLDNEEWVNDDNPYRRQLRPQVLPHLDFDREPGRDEILTYQSLSAQRLLTTIYETDLMFLPRRGMQGRWEDFRAFYSPSNRALAEAIRPALERYSFGFLAKEVEVAGAWTRDELLEYLKNVTIQGTGETPLWEKAIRGSDDPRRAARMWLIQYIPDFLSEASPMIRNILGNYGQAQSEWTKIIIDEYGYGVHETKHSKLFEDTLRSVGLRDDLHHYWQYYMTSSLLANNYFHYLGKNHELFFRYLGALYYTETTLVDFCRRAVSTLTDVFEGEADTKYYSEHVHIDGHHSVMALEKLILPIVDEYGEEVIPEIVRGIEEFRLIAEIADQDFYDQIGWMDAGPVNKSLHDPVWEGMHEKNIKVPIANLVEPCGELSNTHCHDGDELCHIVSGTMRFVSGFESYQILHAGEGTVIRSNRLHGAIIESDECVYEIHSVGDYRRCLS